MNKDSVLCVGPPEEAVAGFVPCDNPIDLGCNHFLVRLLSFQLQAVGLLNELLD